MGPQIQREQLNEKRLDSEPYKNTRQTKRKGKMEGLKVLIAVIFITTSSSLSVSAPVGGAASTAQVLFKHAIAQGVKNAIREMKNIHQLINSSTSIRNSPHMIPNFNNQSCASTKSPKDNLAIAYMKLSDFKSPLYFAFSYEKKQKPKHVQLAAIIKGTSYYVNGSISILRSLMEKKRLPVPSAQTNMSEAQLDEYCRRHLVNHNLMSHVITDDVVKIYRNYLVFSKLKYVLREVFHCVSLIGMNAKSQGH